jgi:hypothetical protein
VSLKVQIPSLFLLLLGITAGLRLAPPATYAQTPTGAAIEPAVAGDAGWDSRFGPPGVDGGGWYVDLFSNPPYQYDDTGVLAVAVSGGDVFVGGKFTSAGGNAANYIARWNSATNSWSPLGAGLNDSVTAIAVDGNNVYVGGNFTTAGGASAIHIARWNRATGAWSALGGGVGNPSTTGERVDALAIGGGVVYAGGKFTAAGGAPASNIARWNGSAWSALGGGVNDRVRALALDASGALYAGGYFSSAGGASANKIARWNGSSWSALGSGAAGSGDSVDAIVAQGTTIYASGSFTSIGGVAANNVARWSGGAWSALGGGIPTTYGVEALALDGSDLYAGGNFNNAAGQTLRDIARWDGVAWRPLGQGVIGSVIELAFGAGVLYAGGAFRQASGVTANRIARWNRTTNVWGPLGPGAQQGGPQNAVSAIVASGGDVYAGGFFGDIGELRALGIARWNRAANTWARVGEAGLESDSWYANALAIRGSALYVGGSFGNVGNVHSSNVIKWDTAAQEWASLGGGVDDDVNALAVAPNGDLYAGGAFATAGGAPADRIARWNGASWSSLGGGISGGAQPEVRALAIVGGQVYAGGSFTSAGGLSANGLAKWNGSAWAPVDPNFSGTVEALAVKGGDLYVGGRFSVAGALGATSIARWNGSAWSALGSGVSAPNDPRFPLNVFVIAVVGNDIYVGGNFTRAGGVSANGIARWNGGAWSALGSGVAGGGPVVGSYVAAIAPGADGALYIGGNFTGAGGRPSSYFGRYAPGDLYRVALPLLRK